VSPTKTAVSMTMPLGSIQGAKTQRGVMPGDAQCMMFKCVLQMCSPRLCWRLEADVENAWGSREPRGRHQAGLPGALRW